MSRRRFLQFLSAATLGTTLAGAGSLVYASQVEPFSLETTYVKLTLPRLAPEFHEYRLVQISDLHMDGDTMTASHLMSVMDAVNRLVPDMVAITGDFFTRRPPDERVQEMITALKMLRARDGVVAVLGNHDHWSGKLIVRQTLKDAGVINVSNAVHTLQRGSALLHWCGVDDVWEHVARLDDVMTVLPNEGAAVMLVHEPDYADTTAPLNRFDLEISGHTHGGQVNLPVLGRLVLPYLGEKYHTGLYQVGTMQHYTNRGLGMVNPKVRFNCRPEITVFILSSPAA